MATTTTPWRRLQHHGDDYNTMAKTTTPWRRLQHHGDDYNTMATTTTPWRRLQHHGDDYNTMATTTTPWRRLQHHGDDNDYCRNVNMYSLMYAMHLGYLCTNDYRVERYNCVIAPPGVYGIYIYIHEVNYVCSFYAKR